MSTALPVANGPARAWRILRRLIPIAATLIALGFIGPHVSGLWNDWSQLREAEARLRETEVIGYVNVSPNPSYAQKPKNWIVTEGDSTRIWAGWVPGRGHTWFAFPRDEFDTRKLGYPFGRDVFRAVDRPMVESGQGKRWDRIPYDSPVVAIDRPGVATAYPLRLLQMAWIVNDRLGDKPTLIVYHPHIEGEVVSILDPVVDGETVSFGSSGHTINRSPILYDRETESLWELQKRDFVAIAGRRKGKVVSCLDRPALTNWASWKSLHPEGRLVVGAERPEPGRPRPSEATDDEAEPPI